MDELERGGTGVPPVIVASTSMGEATMVRRPLRDRIAGGTPAPLIVFLLSLCLCASVVASHPAAAQEFTISSIAAYPPEVSLTTTRASQRIIVIATDDRGVQHDVTAQAQFAGFDPIAEMRGHVIHPKADGVANLTISVGPHSAQIPITVAQASSDRPISFTLDVMPVFMAAGCNSGACHGSARGQDGFRLSLFGFDPQGDYHRITREIAARRINLAQPAESLLLQKALGKVLHTGGKRFEQDSPLYESLHRWIDAGCPRDPADTAQVTDLRLYPEQTVLRAGGATLPFVAIASYSDGAVRDVTHLAVFRTSNETSAAIAGSKTPGAITTGTRGEAFITASFSTFTVGTPLIILPADDPADWMPASSVQPPANVLDELINSKLDKLRLTPSPLCTDEVFLRRAYLDLVGLLPAPEEAAAFLADSAPDKRAKLIDQLLERREFIDQWVMQWAEILQIRSNQEISYKAALLYFEWLRENFTNNVPLDEMVRSILTATGGTFTEPATNFYLNQPDPLVLTENVAQSFMGIRVQCAQCHNHPFDRWTQNDYYGFVSFFTQVGRKQGEDPRERIIFNAGGGEFNHPVLGRPLPPKFLGGGAPDVAGKDRRAVVATWLTSPENPYFARSISNRIWSHFMGIGIVEPVDDFRISNPASNEALLEALAKVLVESKYDLKSLVRLICNSNAYQRATQTNDSNADDLRNFAHAQVRRLRAETLLDVVSDVTNQPEKLRGLPLGARAVEIADGTTTNYFLTTFGRAMRESVCSCEVVLEPSLSQALHLLNGETVHAKILNGNVVGTLLQEGKQPAEIIEILYLRCLVRTPTAEEVQVLLASLEGQPDPKPVLEDIFWSILNSKEFLFNH